MLPHRTPLDEILEMDVLITWSLVLHTLLDLFLLLGILLAEEEHHGQSTEPCEANSG